MKDSEYNELLSLIKSGNVAQAKSIIHPHLARNDSDAYMFLGDIALQEYSYRSALDFYIKAVKYNPRSVRSLCMIVELCTKEVDSRITATKYGNKLKALVEDGGCQDHLLGWAYYCIAWSYYNISRYIKAKQYFKKAAENGYTDAYEYL